MIAEPRQEYKVSVVREAIEESLHYLAREVGFFARGALTFPFGGLPNADEVYTLLRAAWLSLPKCLVCGAEDGQSGRALVLQYMFGWFIDRPAASWREPVCTACRRHPSISAFSRSSET